MHQVLPKSSRIHYVGLALALAFGVLAACGPTHIPTSDPTATPQPSPSVTRPPATVSQVQPTTAAPATTPTPLPEGGSITIGTVGELNFDVNAMPAFLQETIYDSLLKVNPTTGALEPELAESFQVSNDGTMMTFRLRDGLKWHTGDRVTAEDVVATLNAFSSPDFRGTPVTDFGTLVRASAPDDRTVVLTFRESYCPALTSIGVLKILPRSIANSQYFANLKPELLVGTGPLRVQSATSNQIVLTRNPYYASGPIPIETWTLKLYPDIASLRAAFASKQVDVMTAGARDYGTIKGLASGTLLSVPSTDFISLLFNTDNVALNDVRVRQALSYALDRNVLLNDIEKQGVLLDATILPGFWANTSQMPRFTYDVNRAKQLLADAGWRDSGDGFLRKDGRPLTVELWTEADHPVLEPLAFRIREMYAALGLQVELQLDDRPGWITHAFDHRFDLLLLSRKLPLDPDQRWYWQSDQNAKGSGFNFGSYGSARTDALYTEMQKVPSCDPAGRAIMFNEVERNLLIDSPAAFLFAPKNYMVLQERVAGLAPSSFAGDFWNLKDWYVKP